MGGQGAAPTKCSVELTDFQTVLFMSPFRAQQFFWFVWMKQRWSFRDVADKVFFSYCNRVKVTYSKSEIRPVFSLFCEQQVTMVQR